MSDTLRRMEWDGPYYVRAPVLHISKPPFWGQVLVGFSEMNQAERDGLNMKARLKFERMEANGVDMKDPVNWPAHVFVDDASMEIWREMAAGAPDWARECLRRLAECIPEE